VAAAGGGFRSTLRFEGQRLDIDQQTILAQVGWRVRPALSLELGAGAVLGGTLGGAEVTAGGAVTLGVSWLALLETARRPFVSVSLTAGASRARAADARVTALDVRAGVATGKTLADRVTIYVAARAFGGPVSWRIAGEDVVGSDVHHYALGGGVRVVLPWSLDVFVEGMAAGEQSVSAGIGVAF
jgi:hypothetical protein